MSELVTEIILISLISFVSALVTSILGFGAGLVLTPLLTFIMPIKEALGIGAMIFLVTAASKTWWFRREINRGLWRTCLPLSLVGTAIGMILVYFAPERIITALFAAILLFFAMQSLRGRDSSPGRLPTPLYPVFAGIASIMVHAGGVFYYRFCRINGLDRMATVATMAALHFTLNIFKAIFFVGSGLVHSDYLFYLIPSYCLAIIGTRLGRGILKNYISEAVFVRGVSLLLIILAVRMVWALIFPPSVT